MAAAIRVWTSLSSSMSFETGIPATPLCNMLCSSCKEKQHASLSVLPVVPCCHAFLSCCHRVREGPVLTSRQIAKLQALPSRNHKGVCYVFIVTSNSVRGLCMSASLTWHPLALGMSESMLRLWHPRGSTLVAICMFNRCCIHAQYLYRS